MWRAHKPETALIYCSMIGIVACCPLIFIGSGHLIKSRLKKFDAAWRRTSLSTLVKAEIGILSLHGHPLHISAGRIVKRLQTQKPLSAISGASMGTFLGHLVPGLALTLLGLWHIINISRNYFLNGSINFKSRFWHPFTASAPIFKHSEPVLVFSFSIFAILTQVVGFPVFRFAFELDGIEHATMFLHLAVFSGFSLLAEINHKTETLSGFGGVLAASVFSQELLLLHFHSADHVGLEGHYHWLLQLVVLVSFISSLAATYFPTSFPASLVLAISLTFQGCWFINMGFFLWVPEFVPKDCTAQSIHASGELVHGAVTCGSSDADSRARALANLQFSWILAGILFLTGSLCLKWASKCPERGQHTEYERLRCTGAELPLSFDGFEKISSLKHSVTA